MPIKTFKHLDILDNIKSKKDYHNLLRLSRILNVPIYRNTNSDSYDEYPNLTFNNINICGNSSKRETSRISANWIDKNTYIKFCLNWRYSKLILKG